jgi:Zn-dependent peptidase ImmA (M78 family)
MCVPCPDGITIVLYNDCHPIRRIRATLMEEFFHLWLQHEPTRLRLFADAKGTRDFDAAKETEAYGSGAAALIPYKPLRKMLVDDGFSIGRVADHFQVSKPLVEFRAKVTKLLTRARRP